MDGPKPNKDTPWSIDAGVTFCYTNGASPLCDCEMIQITWYIVEEYQNIRFEGGVSALHECRPTAVKWLKKLEVRL